MQHFSHRIYILSATLSDIAPGARFQHKDTQQKLSSLAVRSNYKILFVYMWKILQFAVIAENVHSRSHASKRNEYRYKTQWKISFVHSKWLAK